MKAPVHFTGIPVHKRFFFECPPVWFWRLNTDCTYNCLVSGVNCLNSFGGHFFYIRYSMGFLNSHLILMGPLIGEGGGHRGLQTNKSERLELEEFSQARFSYRG